MINKEKRFWIVEWVSRREVTKSQNDERLNFLRTRRSRRFLVVLFLLLALGVATTPLLPKKPSSVAGDLGGLVLLAVYFLVRSSVRLTADSPDELLDERLIALRDRSYLHSYRIISSVFSIVLLAIFVRIELFKTPFDFSRWWGTGTFFAFVLFMASLPSLVLAWLDKGEDEI